MRRVMPGRRQQRWLSRIVADGLAEKEWFDMDDTDSWVDCYFPQYRDRCGGWQMKPSMN